ncbi:hypothetical protein NADFUDRAFT_84561 [Nadsonia fulvescens var. elongata DSM 6958]|uniref:RING-type domain-containing protein n=1 Tax=Nadsonia fulvescens var. elongata DSM 6958 TaxID=857566 RepID=A0A1E3PCC5_9ASCO|nr:hypothetical protein NADFUDRAFT_84561 [Nadsonia fulvescens var. elongata DSM 6958]
MSSQGPSAGNDDASENYSSPASSSSSSRSDPVTPHEIPTANTGPESNPNAADPAPPTNPLDIHQSVHNQIHQYFVNMAQGGPVGLPQAVSQANPIATGPTDPNNNAPPDPARYLAGLLEGRGTNVTIVHAPIDITALLRQAMGQPPAEQDLAEQDPAEQDLAEQDPAEQDPTEQVPAEENPDEQDPIEQDPVEQDPIEQDPVEQDPIEQDPVEQDPIEQDPIEQDLAEQDPAEENPVEQDPTDLDPMDSTPTEPPTAPNSQSTLNNFLGTMVRGAIHRYVIPAVVNSLSPAGMPPTSTPSAPPSATPSTPTGSEPAPAGQGPRFFHAESMEDALRYIMGNAIPAAPVAPTTTTVPATPAATVPATPAATVLATPATPTASTDSATTAPSQPTARRISLVMPQFNDDQGHMRRISIDINMNQPPGARANNIMQFINQLSNPTTQTTSNENATPNENINNPAFETEISGLNQLGARLAESLDRMIRESNFFRDMRRAPPPRAAAEVIRSLKRIKLSELTDSMGTVCPICYEPYEEGPPITTAPNLVDSDGDTSMVNNDQDPEVSIPETLSGESDSNDVEGNWPVQMSCGHVFGQACIKNWLESNITCPMCRHTVEPESRPEAREPEAHPPQPPQEAQLPQEAQPQQQQQPEGQPPTGGLPTLDHESLGRFIINVLRDMSTGTGASNTGGAGNGNTEGGNSVQRHYVSMTLPIVPLTVVPLPMAPAVPPTMEAPTSEAPPTEAPPTEGPTTEGSTMEAPTTTVPAARNAATTPRVTGPLPPRTTFNGLLNNIFARPQGVNAENNPGQPLIQGTNSGNIITQTIGQLHNLFGGRHSPPAASAAPTTATTTAPTNGVVDGDFEMSDNNSGSNELNGPQLRLGPQRRDSVRASSRNQSHPYSRNSTNNNNNNDNNSSNNQGGD